MLNAAPVSLTVSKGITLTEKGLSSEAGPVVLGHREQFRQFVVNTSAAVIQTLAEVFATAKAVPLADGKVEPSKLRAWEHYNQQVMLLMRGSTSPDEVLRAGQTVVQWCQAVVIAVRVGALPMKDAPEFLAVEYLASEGAKALACSPAEWADYTAWLDDEHTIAGIQRRVAGYGRRDPRPRAVSVTIPWPEYLGAVLTGPGTFLDKVARAASDILFYPDATLLRVLGFTVKVDLGPDLVQAFEVSGPASQEEHLDRMVRFETEVDTYTFRVQRSKARDGRYVYAFRLLQTRMSDMSALMRE